MNYRVMKNAPSRCRYFITKLDFTPSDESCSALQLNAGEHGSSTFPDNIIMKPQLGRRSM